MNRLPRNAPQAPLALTVIVICSGQPQYLRRAVHHHAPWVEQVLVVDVAVDSRCEDPVDHALDPAVSYTRVALAELGSTLLHLTQGLSTPLVVLTDARDFLLPEGTAHCVRLLQDEQEFSASQGHALGYQVQGQRVAYHKRSSMAARSGASALERIAAHTAGALEAWRSVQRTGGLACALEQVVEPATMDAWKAALSCSMLVQSTVKVVPLTSHLLEQPSPTLRDDEPQVDSSAGLVRDLQLASEANRQIFSSTAGQEAIKRFAQVFHQRQGADAPLLFTSDWDSTTAPARRRFEPVQFIEMPYYRPELFEELTHLEFLVHCAPAGSHQVHSLEGVWVQQRQLLVTHPTDTSATRKARCWKALSLGIFNLEVCRALATLLDVDQEAAEREELDEWLERLDAAEASASASLLDATTSGRLLRYLADRTPPAEARAAVLARLPDQTVPKIGFVLLDDSDSIEGVQDTFDSLVASGLRSLRIVVLMSGDLPAVTTGRDAVHFIKVSADNRISRLNRAIAEMDCEWVMLMTAGDRLTEGGLLRLQAELPNVGECTAIVADEVQRDAEGRLVSVLRSGASLERLRAQPMLMAGHWLLRRDLVLELGGYSERFATVMEYDLLLRMVEQRGLAGIAHMDEYLVVANYGTLDQEQALAALSRHLGVLGYQAHVTATAWQSLHVDYRHTGAPPVSILILVPEDLEGLKACLAGISQRTRYPRYEVVLVAGAVLPPATEAFLQRFAQSGGRTRLLRSEQALHEVELINWATTQVDSEYLLLLAPEIRVITPAWIESMLNQARRPEVGVVGVKVLDDDGRVSHAGYELMSDLEVEQPMAGMARQAWGPACGLMVERSCQAVSGVCLMVRKTTFEAVQGLTSELEDREEAAIDLCLKVGAAGATVVWAPQALVSYHGLRLVSPAARLHERWPNAFTARVTEREGVTVDVMGARLGWVDELMEPQS